MNPSSAAPATTSTYSSSSNQLIINALLASQQDTKSLLKQLLNVVKDCQTHYGGKTELATEHDLRIANLCTVWEATFLHGLRTTSTGAAANSMSVLKNVTEMMTNGIGGNVSIESISFWPFVYPMLTGHEKERFSTLRHVWTDCGKSRALIRAALNERALERYVLMWLTERQRLDDNYLPTALLRDDEATNLLPSIAAGLGSILFAVTIDSPNLNVAPSAERAQRLEPIIVAPVPRVRSAAVAAASSRRHKQIISFDADADDARVASNSTSSSVGSEQNAPRAGKSLASMCLKHDAAALPPLAAKTTTLVAEELPGTIFIASSILDMEGASAATDFVAIAEPDFEDGFSGGGVAATKDDHLSLPPSSSAERSVDGSEWTSRSTSSCSNLSANNNNNNFNINNSQTEEMSNDITVIRKQLHEALERCKILENQVDELSL